jgi:hypothetical protein
MVVALFALAAAACDRGGSTTRPLRVRGVPLCPRGVSYARPIVLRVDRDRSLFEDAYSTERTLDTPPPTHDASLDVLRVRMKVTVRLGICAETSLATWDCNAASWVATTTTTLDTRADAMDVTLPPSEVPCADGSVAK